MELLIEQVDGTIMFKFLIDFLLRVHLKLQQERGVNDELHDQLIQVTGEATISKGDAFEESLRRRKAEKDAIEAKRKVNVLFFSQNKYRLFFFNFH